MISQVVAFYDYRYQHLSSKDFSSNNFESFCGNFSEYFKKLLLINKSTPYSSNDALIHLENLFSNSATFLLNPTFLNEINPNETNIYLPCGFGDLQTYFHSTIPHFILLTSYLFTTISY